MLTRDIFRWGTEGGSDFRAKACALQILLFPEFVCAAQHPFLSPASCWLHRWNQCVHRVNLVKSSPCSAQSALRWCCLNAGLTKWHARVFYWIPLALKVCFSWNIAMVQCEGVKGFIKKKSQQSKQYSQLLNRNF